MYRYYQSALEETATYAGELSKQEILKKIIKP